MKASRSHRPPNGVSVEPYRSTLTPSVSGGVEVNTELKLQCSTLTNDSDQQEVSKNGIVCMVNAGVGVKHKEADGHGGGGGIIQRREDG